MNVQKFLNSQHICGALQNISVFASYTSIALNTNISIFVIHFRQYLIRVKHEFARPVSILARCYLTCKQSFTYLHVHQYWLKKLNFAISPVSNMWAFSTIFYGQFWNFLAIILVEKKCIFARCVSTARKEKFEILQIASCKFVSIYMWIA